MPPGSRSSDPIRVAYIGPSPGEAGGVPRVAYLLLRELPACGAEVDVYALDCPRSLAEVDGIRAITSPVDTSLSFRLLRRSLLLLFVWGQLRRARAQARLIRRAAAEHRVRRYDILYQFSQPELLGVRRRRRRLPPVVVHPETHAAGELAAHRREDALVRRGERSWRVAAVRLMLRARASVQRRDLTSVERVIAPSRLFADAIGRDYGVQAARTTVVPNPVDLERFVPQPRVQGPIEIAFVARISVRKGVEMVVELSNRIADLAPSVRLVVVGTLSLWSDYRPLLNDLNTDVAEYRAHVDARELPRLLSSAALAVQPSHYEPFALTVAESLACGTPVVVSDAVGAAEWLDQTCCEVFPDGDMDAFEQAVRTMLMRVTTNENELRAAARAAAERNFAPDIVARSVLDALCAAAMPRSEAG